MATSHKIVRAQIADRGIKDEIILEAFEKIDRALFVPEEMKERAYEDLELPIGHGQHISEPYMVAYMAEVLKLSPSHKVLEIGTGCGYSTAILSQLADKIFSVEILEDLVEIAQRNLKQVKVDNIAIKQGDGFFGWEEEQPFDAIILHTAPQNIPQPLVDQLKSGGKLIGPVGVFSQNLLLVEKLSDGEIRETVLIPANFKRMMGEAGKSFE